MKQFNDSQMQDFVKQLLSDPRWEQLCEETKEKLMQESLNTKPNEINNREELYKIAISIDYLTQKIQSYRNRIINIMIETI